MPAVPVCLTNEALQDITCMHISGAQRDEFLAVQLAEVAVDQLDETTQLGDLRSNEVAQQATPVVSHMQPHTFGRKIPGSAQWYHID